MTDERRKDIKVMDVEEGIMCVRSKYCEKKESVFVRQGEGKGWGFRA